MVKTRYPSGLLNRDAYLNNTGSGIVIYNDVFSADYLKRIDWDLPDMHPLEFMLNYVKDEHHGLCVILYFCYEYMPMITDGDLLYMSDCTKTPKTTTFEQLKELINAITPNVGKSAP